MRSSDTRETHPRDTDSALLSLRFLLTWPFLLYVFIDTGQRQESRTIILCRVSCLPLASLYVGAVASVDVCPT